MPISSIQATVAKLSIRPPSFDHELEPGQDQMPSVSEVVSTVEPDSTHMTLQTSQDPLYEAMPDSISPPLSCTSSPGKTQSPSSPSGQGNGFTGSTPASPVTNHHPATEAVSQAPSPPPSSSLDLLASLTPEAFNMDSANRGKQRISKQSFLQPQEGKGLQRTPEGDDPLSSLDPLWTLNKSWNNITKLSFIFSPTGSPLMNGFWPCVTSCPCSCLLDLITVCMSVRLCPEKYFFSWHFSSSDPGYIP